MCTRVNCGLDFTQCLPVRDVVLAFVTLLVLLTEWRPSRRERDDIDATKVTPYTAILELRQYTRQMLPAMINRMKALSQLLHIPHLNLKPKLHVYIN